MGFLCSLKIAFLLASVIFLHALFSALSIVALICFFLFDFSSFNP